MKSAKNVVAVLFALILVISSSAFGVNAGIYSPAEQPEAAGIYVVNEDTGLVMYEKNADERLYPASLTKIMTALLVIENISDPDSTVCTMTNRARGLWL